MILLTGATGNTGGQVAALLKARGVPFVVMVRSEKARAKLAGLGYETVRGDFDRRDSLDAALARGFTRAYLVCTPDERMIPRECNFIDAARAAGVKRVVKLSAFLAGPDAPTINLRSHGQIERRLMDSGMQWSIVRPHGFMQTFVLFTLDFIRGAGLYMQPAGDGAMPLVDVRDVAEVGFKALTEDGHAGQAYDVTGPEPLTCKRQAEILARGLGRPVSYIDGSERGFTMALKMLGVAPQSIEHAMIIMRMCRAHAIDRATDTLQRLGIVPRTFEQFVDDLVAGRTGGGNSFEPPDSALAKAMGLGMQWFYRARFALLGRPA